MAKAIRKANSAREKAMKGRQRAEADVASRKKQLAAEKRHLRDLKKIEYWQLVPLVILMVWLGVAPNMFMKYSEQAVRHVVGQVEHFKFSASTAGNVDQTP